MRRFSGERIDLSDHSRFGSAISGERVHAWTRAINSVFHEMRREEAAAKKKRDEQDRLATDNKSNGMSAKPTSLVDSYKIKPIDIQVRRNSSTESERSFAVATRKDEIDAQHHRNLARRAQELFDSKVELLIRIITRQVEKAAIMNTIIRLQISSDSSSHS